MNEVIEAIQTLLSNALWSTYKKYYYWEIKVPNQKNLPFIEIMPLWSNIINRGTWWMADNTFNIQITVKNTLKKYLKQNTNVNTVAHIQDLIKKIEDRNADGTIKSGTVLWVLHNNLQLSDTVHINDDWVITYDEIDLWESYITFATIVFSGKLITM